MLSPGATETSILRFPFTRFHTQKECKIEMLMPRLILKIKLTNELPYFVIYFLSMF